MKSIKSLKSLVKRKTNAQEVSKSGWKMKPFLALMCTALLIFWYKTTNIQFEQTEVLLEPILLSEMWGFD